MAFCSNCGTQLNDGARFCPSCGQSAGDGSAQQVSAAVGTQQPPGYQPPVVPGAPQQSDIRDAQDGRTMGILAYLLFFIPLLTGAHKTSPFVKYHTNQGTVLFIAALIYSVAYAIISAILIFIPIVGLLVIIVLGFGGLFFLALCIVGIMNAAGGRMRPLPVLGGFTVIS